MEVSQQTVKALIKRFTGQAQMLVVPRPFIKLTGDHVSALLLNQIIYWAERTEDPEGWFYKTEDQWKEELCISPYQLRRACDVLAKFGVEKKVRKINGAPRLNFRIDAEVFANAFTVFLESEETSLSRNLIIKKLDNQETPLSDNEVSSLSDNEVSSLSFIDSEITTEITTETTETRTCVRAQGDPPDWLDAETWRRWLRHRQEIKHPVNPEQAEAQFRKLDAYRARGSPPEQVLEQSIANGWRGLFELKGESNGAGEGNASQNRGTNQQPGGAGGVVRKRTAYDPFAGKPVI